jgi:hypothetical protein
MKRAVKSAVKSSVRSVVRHTYVLITSLAILVGGGLIIHTPSAEAAPEDRGEKGAMFSLGAGGFVGTGTDTEASDVGGVMGSTFTFSAREEVWPKLSLGLAGCYHMGTSDRFEELSLGALYIDARWRFGGGLRGLNLSGGLGIGGGGFAASVSGAEDASAGGAIWRVGVGYELGPKEVGWSVTPTLSYEQLRAQMDSEVSLNLISLSVELTWELGR